MTVFWSLIASYAGALVVGSFFEWTLHKYLMHGVLIKAYPYNTHDPVHHVIFDSGRNYHLHDRHEEKHLVTMAWWNAPVLMLANAPLPVGLALLLGNWWIVLGAMLGYVSYYIAY